MGKPGCLGLLCGTPDGNRLGIPFFEYGGDFSADPDVFTLFAAIGDVTVLIEFYAI